MDPRKRKPGKSTRPSASNHPSTRSRSMRPGSYGSNQVTQSRPSESNTTAHWKQKIKKILFGKTEKDQLPLYVRILLNLAGAVPIYLIIQNYISLACFPLLFGVSLSIITLIFIYILCQVVLIVAPTVKIKDNKLKTIAKSLLKLQPWQIAEPQRLFTVNILLVIVVFVPSGLYSLLLYTPDDELPVVQSLFVTLDGEPRRPVHSGDLVEIGAGEQATFEATLQPEQLKCTWSTITGNFHREAGCSILYTAPIVKDHDVLTLAVNSACKTKQTMVGIPIEIE